MSRYAELMAPQAFDLLRWRGATRVADIAWGLLGRSAAANVACFYSVCPEEVACFLGGRILNFGCWETGREDHQSAGRALVRKVAELAGIETGQDVLDVGCGFGIAALAFQREHGAGRVVGLNVTPCQLEYANRLARAERAADAVRFLAGDATDMPLADRSFDRVIALESAFHFSPREAFFREAWRVLRPGGILTLADVVPRQPRAGRLLKGLAALLWLVPPANGYDADGYRDRLARAGFGPIEMVSIRGKVYQPYARWTLAPENVARLKKLLGWSRAQVYLWQTRLLDLLDRRGLLDYVLVRAVKEKVQ